MLFWFGFRQRRLVVESSSFDFLYISRSLTFVWPYFETGTIWLFCPISRPLTALSPSGDPVLLLFSISSPSFSGSSPTLGIVSLTLSNISSCSCPWSPGVNWRLSWMSFRNELPDRLKLLTLCTVIFSYRPSISMLLVASYGVSHLSWPNRLNTALPSRWALVILYLCFSIELSVFVLIVNRISACFIFSCEPSLEGLVFTSMWGKFICCKSIFEHAPIDD